MVKTKKEEYLYNKQSFCQVLENIFSHRFVRHIQILPIEGAVIYHKNTFMLVFFLNVDEINRPKQNSYIKNKKLDI